MLTAAHAQDFERCIRDGGLAVFPADTVYGLACDPGSERAVERLYELKVRSPDKPAAVMFFALELALAELLELGSRTRAALSALMPGAVTVLLPNTGRRFTLACGPDPATLGLRVPLMEGACAALGTVGMPVLQSSANRSGAGAVRSLSQVPRDLLDAADLVLDGGDLPGTPSTVIDLRDLESGGRWAVIRPGAVAADEIARLLK